LQRGEVGTRDRRARLFVDLDGNIGDDVLGPWRAVVVDDQAVPEHLLDGVSAAHRTGDARKGGVREQVADPCEIAAVHEFGIGCDEVLDGPVRRSAHAMRE